MLHEHGPGSVTRGSAPSCYTARDPHRSAAWAPDVAELSVTVLFVQIVLFSLEGQGQDKFKVSRMAGPSHSPLLV